MLAINKSFNMIVLHWFTEYEVRISPVSNVGM